MAEKSSRNHAFGGYVTVDQFPSKNKHSDEILNGWKELGLQEIDYNSQTEMVGTARLQFTIVNGLRQSANGAYVRPIRGRRKNLIIKTKAMVTRIIIDSRMKKAVGVEYVLENGSMKRIFARKEVIVSAGAVDSPKLLMLSGIGPVDELREANIPLVKELSVGKNLQDHPNVQAVPFKISKDQSVIGDYEDAQNDFTEWLSTHEGVAGNLGIFDSMTFMQTPFENRSDVVDVVAYFFGSLSGKPLMPLTYYDQGFMAVGLLNPKSRGVIKLNKTDPIFGSPLIYANYLTHEDDVRTIIAGFRMARKIFDTKALKRVNISEERYSRCECYEDDSDEYWYCVLKHYTDTYYHPVGTCKMGPKSDIHAVVDSNLKVYGIDGLRVIDASIMPRIVRGNTNIPVYMIAEKGSDMIKDYWLKRRFDCSS